MNFNLEIQHLKEPNNQNEINTNSNDNKNNKEDIIKKEENKIENLIDD
jgi:hypothetical protein